MSKLIIGIHGLANKPERTVLENYWRDSIAEGLEKNSEIAAPKFEFRIVYWADLLYKSAMHEDKNFNFDGLYNEEPYIPADPGALKERKDNWFDDTAAFGRGLVGSGVDHLKEYFGMDALADWVLGRVLKEYAATNDQKEHLDDKFFHYRQIEPFVEYILVSQKDCHLERFMCRSDNAWIYSEFKALADVIELKSMACSVGLDDIYGKI